MSTHEKIFLKHLAQTSESPIGLEIESAKGCNFIDKNGKKYLDLISGISVSTLGHGNKKINRAVKKQVDKNMHLMVYGEFIQKPQVHLAEYLTSLLPKNLSSVYFVNSGSEAIEGALKLAKRFTGRAKILAMRNGYHGGTHGAMSLMSNEYFTQKYRPLLPEISFLEPENRSQLDLIDTSTAAVVLELIQTEAGCNVHTLEYIAALRAKCNETGTLLILDEVQTGMGRTGTMFCFESYHVIPDILVTGKALGGGMPLGAFISSQEIMKTLSANPVLGHITTFGGHPVCCAASLAALQQINEQKLWQNATSIESIVKNKLISKNIISISGKGALMAIELKDEETVQKVIKECLNKGLFTDWFLFASNKLRISPPLVISKKVFNFAMETLNKCINEI